jgi:hypothetical protein
MRPILMMTRTLFINEEKIMKLSDALFRAGRSMMNAEMNANEIIAARLNGDEKREDETIPAIMGNAGEALAALANAQVLAERLGVPIYDKDLRTRLDDEHKRQELKVDLRGALIGAIIDELENRSQAQKDKIKKYTA